MPTKLQTQNANALTYQGEEVHLTVLGGIRLDGLDRMRVTLKIEVGQRVNDHYLSHPELANLALRHSLDLYNDTAVDKLIRRAAEKLEVGTIGLTKAFAELTDELEAYRLELIEAQQIKEVTPHKLTPAQKKAAKSYLSSSELLTRTREDIGRAGVIGEEDNRLLMYLIFTSRKRSHPLHVISLGASGSGKTWLQEKVGELIPEEDKLEITVLSENAFYYFGQHELAHKLLLIEDLDGAENALYPLREIQSKKRITKTVARKDHRGNTRTTRLVVEGPVAVAGCTTKERVYEDNANRSFLIYPDDSANQDERIMEYQRRLSAGKVDVEAERKIKTLFQNCQRILEPVAVRNPYAEALKIPAEVFKPRRTNAHYLGFVEAVTFYHQFQREHQTDPDTGEIFIETTLEDIQAANALMADVLLRKADELSGACRRYFESLKSYLKQNNTTVFRAGAVRLALRVNVSNQKRYMAQLLQQQYITITGGSPQSGYQVIAPKVASNLWHLIHG